MAEEQHKHKEEQKRENELEKALEQIKSAYSMKMQKLCLHCGEKIGVFGSCKKCKKKSSDIPTLIVPMGGYNYRVLEMSNGMALLLSDKIIKKELITKAVTHHGQRATFTDI